MYPVRKEDVERWLESPVTRLVMATYATDAQTIKKSYLEAAWIAPMDEYRRGWANGASSVANAVGNLTADEVMEWQEDENDALH